MMANVLHPHIDFQPRPVSHAPSSFGFGFGLGPSPSNSMMPPSGWATPGHTNPAAFQHLANYMSASASARPQKRRMSSEEEEENGRYSSTPRDESMDRSPTPERPKATAPKRARAAYATSPGPKEITTEKQNKAQSGSDGNDIDVGLLLANLPTESYLPLLMELLRKNPTLKGTLLPLIPRPTVESAIRILFRSAEKLTQAYPYSINGPQSTMRADYISSRLQQHVADYVSTCMSYFTYFSCIPPSPQTPAPSPGSSQNPIASPTPSFHRVVSPPYETFLFLKAVTEQILKQPPTSRDELLKSLVDRLKVEWQAWHSKTQHDFEQGRIYGTEILQKYAHGLASLSDSASGTKLSPTMSTVRNDLMGKNHWLFYPILNRMEQ